MAEAHGSRQDQPMTHQTPSQDFPVLYQLEKTLPRIEA